jgi:hypothetical protein
MSQKQKQFFLMEQLKNIKRELGMEKDEKEARSTNALSLPTGPLTWPACVSGACQEAQVPNGEADPARRCQTRH